MLIIYMASSFQFLPLQLYLFLTQPCISSSIYNISFSIQDKCDFIHNWKLQLSSSDLLFHSIFFFLILYIIFVTSRLVNQTAALMIEKAWIGFRDRQMFRLLKHSLCAAVRFKSLYLITILETYKFLEI